MIPIYKKKHNAYKQNKTERKLNKFKNKLDKVKIIEFIPLNPSILSENINNLESDKTEPIQENDSFINDEQEIHDDFQLTDSLITIQAFSGNNELKHLVQSGNLKEIKQSII